MDIRTDTTRRRFLLTAGTIVVGGRVLAIDEALAQDLPPTPECRDGEEPTVPQTEGPFFKPRSPERADLRERETRAPTVELTGRVLTRRCRPVGRALVDLWHADERGDYDNRGFRYRGHQYADADGVYRFRTVRPARYTGRTAHYHVKVQAPGGRILTTQLYFPDEPGNARDFLFRRELLMRTAKADGGLAARFDFVLDMP
jgi:protocatechuate 3,4-dioxygenase beta subunit